MDGALGNIHGCMPVMRLRGLRSVKDSLSVLGCTDERS